MARRISPDKRSPLEGSRCCRETGRGQHCNCGRAGLGFCRLHDSGRCASLAAFPCRVLLDRCHSARSGMRACGPRPLVTGRRAPFDSTPARYCGALHARLSAFQAAAPCSLPSIPCLGAALSRGRLRISSQRDFELPRGSALCSSRSTSPVPRVPAAVGRRASRGLVYRTDASGVGLHCAVDGSCGARGHSTQRGRQCP